MYVPFQLPSMHHEYFKNITHNGSIYTSRCIVVLNVLLEDYTTAYVCTYTHFFHMFLKVVLVSCYQIV